MLGLFRGDVLRRALDAVLGLALDTGQAEVDDFHVAGPAEQDVVGLEVAVVDAAAVHVDHAVGHALEDLHHHRQRDARAGVQGLAVDVFDEQVGLADAEHPVLDRFQGVDLDEVGVFEHLGDAEFVLGLFEELLVVGTVDGHDLEGVVLAVGGAADVKDLAVGAGAERADDGEFADLQFAHEVASGSEDGPDGPCYRARPGRTKETKGAGMGRFRGVHRRERIKTWPVFARDMAVGDSRPEKNFGRHTTRTEGLLTLLHGPTRDRRRISGAIPPYLRPFIGAAARRLLAEVRIDPHLKGSPAPMPGHPHMRQLDRAGVRIYFQVRQPPLPDRYVEVVAFSLVP